MSADNTKAGRSPGDASERDSLRARAERYFETQPPHETPQVEDAESLLHELQVHQIELEMQNEELRRTQLDLDAERAKYFDLYDLAPVGYVTIDSSGLITETNLTAAASLGLDRSQLVGAPLERYVFWDDADAYYLNMLRLKEGSKESAGFQIRLMRQERAFWVRIQARAQASIGSAESELHITFTDIDELTQAQDAERRAAERLQAVVRASHDMIYTLDPHGAVLFASPSLTTLLGYEPHELVGRSFADLVHKDDALRSQQALRHVVRDSREDAVVEYRIRHNDGTWRWFESHIAPMCNPDGSVVEYVGNARDITNRKSQDTEMQQMAMTDELTGIGNRRMFIRAMSKELKRSRRYNYGLSMLMVDVDNLKTINDTFGHPVGDGVLQTVARVCAEVCREDDEACRIGGDEFAVLLPHSTGEAAYDVGERIREALRHQPTVPGMPRHYTISVSIGVGTVDPGDTDYSELVERADSALLSAKEHGRDRTCV